MDQHTIALARCNGLMRNVEFLRKRAAKYRRLAEETEDADVADSYRLLAEIDEQEATQIERSR